MTDRHQQKPYPLRMPDELREELERAAASAGRSLHAEIIGRLKGTVRDRPQADTERVLRLQVEIAAARQEQVLHKTEEYQAHMEMERLVRMEASLTSEVERAAARKALDATRAKLFQSAKEGEAIRERIARLERELMAALTARP